VNDSILDSARQLDIDLQGLNLIEASAGTGKTYTIANLYLRQVLQGRSCSDILVVSFTNATTDELHQRIRARLYAASAVLKADIESSDEFLALLQRQHRSLEASAQAQRERYLQIALRSMDEAAIATINGFCQSALQDHALLSNRLFESELNSDDSADWDNALKDWWRRTSYPLSASEWPLFNQAIPSLKDLLGWQSQIRRHPVNRFVPEVNRTLAQLFQQLAEQLPQLESLATGWKQHGHQLFELFNETKVLSRAKNCPFHKDNIGLLYAQLDDYFNGDALSIVPAQLELLSREKLDFWSTPKKRGLEEGFEHPFIGEVGKFCTALHSIRNDFKVQALIDAHQYAGKAVLEKKLQARQLSYQDQLDLLLMALESPGGDLLAERLRERFPVAMIDEFQDTDPVQYRIFKHIYFEQDAVSLTLIGDPKQAIYSFRGGDIFTYINARNETGVKRYSLQTNWRSEGALIAAVNTIFEQHPEPFIYHQAIKFTPAMPAPRLASRPLQINGQTTTALTLWKLPLDENARPFAKAQISNLINTAVVDEIAQLIKPANAFLGTDPVESGDIAILVRSAYEGDALRLALSAAGIKSVTIGKDKVFQSEEARGLYHLLEAIVQPDNDRCLRRARGCSLLGENYNMLAACFDHDREWQAWIDRLFELHSFWSKRGFIAMFQHLLESLQPGSAIANKAFAERRLTNLLQLSELLQQQSRRNPGMHALLNWFRQQLDSSAQDDAELRLESDAHLVKIVTIHKSKGLEYPIVFVPFLWGCKPVDKKAALLRFHDDHHQAILDLGSEQFDQHYLIAEKERLAEDLRLLYVALTRARSKVYLVWGDAGGGQSKDHSRATALAYLLHSRQKAADLDRQTPVGYNDPVEMLEQIDAFADQHNNIEALDLPAPLQNAIAEIDRQDVIPDLKLAKLVNPPGSQWRINSFSGLTRDIHQQTHAAFNATDNDSILDFPAGSHVGLLLHEILEYLDFQQDITSQSRHLIARLAPGYGLHSVEQQKLLENWIGEIVATEFGAGGLALSALAPEHRLNELKFDFSVAQIDMDALNQFLQDYNDRPVSAVTADNFRGLITGVIDLVFVFQGKYYLADYKSNLLGKTLQDYLPEALQQAMLDRRYDLQSLLYSIALHRYLAYRLPDYDYDVHFGGSYYLFLRAMRVPTKDRHGVHFSRPMRTQITALDDILNARQTAETGR
jgi:exodeoxyribonuclease V beta subunit